MFSAAPNFWTPLFFGQGDKRGLGNRVTRPFCPPPSSAAGSGVVDVDQDGLARRAWHAWPVELLARTRSTGTAHSGREWSSRVGWPASGQRRPPVSDQRRAVGGCRKLGDAPSGPRRGIRRNNCPTDCWYRSQLLRCHWHKLTICTRCSTPWEAYGKLEPPQRGRGSKTLWPCSSTG